MGKQNLDHKEIEVFKRKCPLHASEHLIGKAIDLSKS